MATDTQVLHLRVPLELHARLAAFAKRTERSANGAAVFAIRTFLEQHDTLNGELAEPITHLR